MDQHVKSFLADVLALAGEDLDAVREGVRVALASCEALFRVREPNNRRALEARAERHRPAGALSCPSAAMKQTTMNCNARRPRAGPEKANGSFWCLTAPQ